MDFMLYILQSVFVPYPWLQPNYLQSGVDNTYIWMYFGEYSRHPSHLQVVDLSKGLELALLCTVSNSNPMFFPILHVCNAISNVAFDCRVFDRSRWRRVWYLVWLTFRRPLFWGFLLWRSFVGLVCRTKEKNNNITILRCGYPLGPGNQSVCVGVSVTILTFDFKRK